MEYLWDSEAFIDDNTLTVNIKRLRSKLEELNLQDLIETRRGTRIYIKMKKIDFIKDKKLYIILTVFLIITCEILLIPFKMSIFIKAYIGITPLIILIIVLTAEYYKKKAFYNKLMQNMEELKEKYLISEIISTPDFMEGRILKELLNDLSKSMIENVNNYKYQLEDYKEFIELWIHEIKMPIATSKMIIENNKNEITKSIDEEIDKIDNYVEQALFYARSNTVEKDYCIKKDKFAGFNKL